MASIYDIFQKFVALWSIFILYLIVLVFAEKIILYSINQAYYAFFIAFILLLLPEQS